MAQLVARDFWEVEAAGSSPVTQTTFFRNSFQGVAQLVARSVRDAEAVGSSPITLTKKLDYVGVWRSPVARTHGVREVRSSNLLTPTILKRFLALFLFALLLANPHLPFLMPPLPLSVEILTQSTHPKLHPVPLCAFYLLFP